MAVVIPGVTNWSVTPQNGVEGYFTLMNTWLTESTTVISSFNTAVQKVNESNSEMNTLSNQVTTNKNTVENNKNLTEQYKNEAKGYRDQVVSYVIPTEATYNTTTIDSKMNAIAPYSGYLQVSKKLDNFYFQTSSSFIASFADKSRYVKFLEKRIETWSAVIQTTSTQTANATATTLTMSNTTGLTVGKVIAILKGDLLVHTSVITAVSTNVSITVLNSFNREATAYKIKIIQSINLNDYIPEVLVQDEGINGLIIQSSVNAGDYVVVDRIVQTGVELYRAKINAPIGTSLTNTTYFETRDSIGVTNQIGVFHKYNTLTNSYEGLSAEILFSDVSKEDLLDNSTWLARNGFSNAGEFCYAKDNDTYLYLPVSIWQSLNKGAYGINNQCGTKACRLSTDSASNYWIWYGTHGADLDNNIASYFKYASTSTTYGSGSITYANGHQSYNGTSFVSTRPDSKFYDIVYPDQITDVREYAKLLNKWEVDLIRADKEENGVAETAFTERTTQTTTGTIATLEVGNGANYRLGSVLQIWNGTTPYRRYVVSVSGNTVTLDSTIVKTAVPFIISGGKIPSLGSNTSLKSRLLGTPTNFPTIMLNRLTESKYIIGLDLQMVDDSGNNQLFDGVKDSFKLGDKFTSILQSLRSTNSGSTYTAFTATNSTTTNTLTLTNEPTANIVLVSMTAKNVPYVQKLTADYEIIWEDDYVYASNNYDISKKIPVLINNVTGKVSTGTDSVEQLAITKIMNDLIYQTAKTATVDATIRKFIAVKNNVFYAGLRYDIGDTASIDLTDTYVYILPLGCRR